MLKTVSRLLLILAVLGALVAWLLLRDDRAGWRWVSHGGWHTTARISALTPQEREWAAIAWRYFENNTQDATGLVNGSDKTPRRFALADRRRADCPYRRARAGSGG
ncbi:FIG00553737: hypothetical protein [Cronobacter dublinensis 1210]|uniref:DUF3131 domain-containing protein n=1 Tax=Cronobacter dublinensis 1210 TaxID=1208656 RepID=A0ABM9QAB2_9ENTR|nr:FIG00553737: hypothetical protein [Cronobacter dublinensis 1210]